jgi:hypothetical protein
MKIKKEVQFAASYKLLLHVLQEGVSTQYLKQVGIELQMTLGSR